MSPLEQGTAKINEGIEMIRLHLEDLTRNAGNIDTRLARVHHAELVRYKNVCTIVYPELKESWGKAMAAIRRRQAQPPQAPVL